MAPRKSILFLDSFIPVTKTRDELIRDKFKPGKFIFTVAGCLKITALLIYIITLFILHASTYCDNEPTYKNIETGVLAGSIAIVLLLYTIFALGFIVKKPLLWVIGDIVGNLIFTIIVIICTALTTISCSKESGLNDAVAPMSFIGSGILICSCGALFLLYRYKEDEDSEDEADQIRRKIIKQKQMDSRKSIFA